MIVPHLDAGSVFPLDVQFTGGGNARWIINLIVMEPVGDDEGDDPARKA
jgi:hypothetical protein